MRRAIFVFVLLLGACSTGEEEAVLCGENRQWGCSEPKTPEEWRKYKDDTQRIRLAAARELDIDYEKCAVVVLTAEVKRQTLEHRDRVFISVLGQDPTPRMLALLGAAGIRAEPASLMPEDEDQGDILVSPSSHWRFSFINIYPRWFGRYRAIAGYHCGMLCSAVTEYRLKKMGDSCAIQSDTVLVVS